MNYEQFMKVGACDACAFELVSLSRVTDRSQRTLIMFADGSVAETLSLMTSGPLRYAQVTRNATVDSDPAQIEVGVCTRLSLFAVPPISAIR